MRKTSYVEEKGGASRIRGSRVSLDSIVHAFQNGQTPESIVQMFPTLSLEQVYGAITHYLAHQADVDAYLKQGREDFERQGRESRTNDPDFYGRFSGLRCPPPEH